MYCLIVGMKWILKVYCVMCGGNIIFFDFLFLWLKKKEKFELNCKLLEYILLINKYFYYFLIFYNNIGIVIVEKERVFLFLGN